jgi:hypothetical protein
VPSRASSFSSHALTKSTVLGGRYSLNFLA